MKRVLIIDPIFRGSRLFYTQMAAALGEDVTILSRTDARTEASEQAFAEKPVDLREVVTTSADSWYYHLSLAQMEELGVAVDQVLANDLFDLIFMAGLDEIASGIAAILKRNAGKLAQTSVIAIHYNPSLAAREKIRNIPVPKPLRRFLPSGPFARISQEFERLRQHGIPGLRIGLLDEDIFDRVRTRKLFILQPDPPPPSLPPSGEDYALAQSPGGTPNLLLVGRQSRRKGFDDIRRLLELKSESLPPGCRMVLCGQLEAETEHHRAFIVSSAPDLLHIDEYLSDQQIRARYEAADFVILPYTTDFRGSSGVLVSAAAAGTPVISTDHGVIGSRVARHGLGYTYPSGDIDRLAEIMRSLPMPDSPVYAEFQKRCRDYAERNSIQAFRTKLEDTIGQNHA